MQEEGEEEEEEVQEEKEDSFELDASFNAFHLLRCSAFFLQVSHIFVTFWLPSFTTLAKVGV